MRDCSTRHFTFIRGILVENGMVSEVIVKLFGRRAQRERRGSSEKLHVIFQIALHHHATNLE